MSSHTRSVVLVSAGLGLEGGGRAVAGRLYAAALAELAVDLDFTFEILVLSSAPPPGLLPPAQLREFGGRRAALVTSVLRRQWRGERPAIVFDLLGLARMQALLPARRVAPFAVVLYGIDAWRPQRWSARRALARSRRRLAISRTTAGRARPFLPAGVIDVLPLALEEREPAGTRDTALLDRVGEGFFLIVGRMAASERYKGHDLLLEALSGSGPGARLIVAGEGDDRPRLEARAHALGVAERVTFTGFVSEATLAALYSRCLALVMPSREEGFGLVYLEAMRAAKPCVAARASAAAEVVADGETGILVDPTDRGELEAALRRLATEPEVAARMGRAGERRRRDEFGRGRFVERLRPIVHSLLESTGGSGGTEARDVRH